MRFLISFGGVVQLGEVTAFGALHCYWKQVLSLATMFRGVLFIRVI